METYTPIELLKNKLTELKSIPLGDANLITEYEKAILVLEFIGVKAFDEKAKDPNKMRSSDSHPNSPSKKEPESYYERFMEGQKNRNRATE